MAAGRGFQTSESAVVRLIALRRAQVSAELGATLEESNPLSVAANASLEVSSALSELANAFSERFERSCAEQQALFGIIDRSVGSNRTLLWEHRVLLRNNRALFRQQQTLFREN